MLPQLDGFPEDFPFGSPYVLGMDVSISALKELADGGSLSLPAGRLPSTMPASKISIARPLEIGDRIGYFYAPCVYWRQSETVPEYTEVICRYKSEMPTRKHERFLIAIADSPAELAIAAQEWILGSNK